MCNAAPLRERTPDIRIDRPDLASCVQPVRMLKDQCNRLQKY